MNEITVLPVCPICGAKMSATKSEGRWMIECKHKWGHTIVVEATTERAAENKWRKIARSEK